MNTPAFTQQVADFAAVLQVEQEAGYRRQYGHDFPDLCRQTCHVTLTARRKYTAVDIGRSGRFLVVNATGDIYGIKAYGVIHPGYHFGTLSTIARYHWSGYWPVERRTLTA